jgi:formate/nitrite transporter FocA (FNT family)
MDKSPATRESEKSFDDSEIEEIERKTPISPPVVFEVIRRGGEKELSRPGSALMASGLVAGIALGFSVLSEALLRAHLPDADWRPLVENLGYSVGFILVILGQMQLFTENTITVVSPALADPCAAVFRAVLRVWGLVLAANLGGATAFALILWMSGPYQPDLFAALLDLSQHATGYPFWETLWRGVGAGWLIAAMVWITSTTERLSLPLIIIVTYVIALADFSHVIAGTTEAMLLVFTGEIGVGAAAGGFVLPALLGNILGGTVLFTLLTWAQIRADLKREKHDRW